MKVGIFLTCQYPPGSDMVAALETSMQWRGWRVIVAGTPSRPASIT